jgi:ribosome-associated translation inhibitor RaiA
MVIDNPSDLFHIGDHILVFYTKSKHCGRTGIVTKVSNPCLSVKFDDERPGSYVDYKFARLMTSTQTMRRTDNVVNDESMTVVSGGAEEGDDALVSLMESLTIQTAVSALAGANDMTDVEKAIEEQAERIRTQARRLLQRRSTS